MRSERRKAQKRLLDNGVGHNEVMERTPQAVYDELKAGNQRFAREEWSHPHRDEVRREAMTKGQNPPVVVLACSDSRVPVELIFDQGLGDIFVIRTAGEILDEAVQGSLEFAVDSLGCPLLVVLGHEKCGAVAATRAALSGGPIPSGYQSALVQKVAPSILKAQAEGKNETADFEKAHVVNTVENILMRSPHMRTKIEEGTLGVVGMRYRLSDCRVEELLALGVEA